MTKKIQILGTGCPKCRKLEETVRTAADELGLDCVIEKVTEITEIVSFGIMTTPGLVVDGEVKIAGKVPPLEKVKELIG